MGKCTEVREIERNFCHKLYSHIVCPLSFPQYFFANPVANKYLFSAIHFLAGGTVKYSPYLNFFQKKYFRWFVLILKHVHEYSE